MKNPGGKSWPRFACCGGAYTNKAQAIAHLVKVHRVTRSTAEAMVEALSPKKCFLSKTVDTAENAG
jgi:hypothetical protein